MLSPNSIKISPTVTPVLSPLMTPRIIAPKVFAEEKKIEKVCAKNLNNDVNFQKLASCMKKYFDPNRIFGKSPNEIIYLFCNENSMSDKSPTPPSSPKSVNSTESKTGNISVNKQKDLLFISNSYSNLNKRFCMMASLGEYEIVKYFIDKEIVKLNYLHHTKMECLPYPADSCTALSCAVAAGQVKIVELLLKSIEILEVPGLSLNNPLHVAVLAGNIEILNMLLKSANINYQNCDGNTALMLAIEKDNLEIVGLLARNNAKLCLLNKKGENAFKLAQKKGKDNLIYRYLFSYEEEYANRARALIQKKLAAIPEFSVMYRKRAIVDNQMHENTGWTLKNNFKCLYFILYPFIFTMDFILYSFKSVFGILAKKQENNLSCVNHKYHILRNDLNSNYFKMLKFPSQTYFAIIKNNFSKIENAIKYDVDMLNICLTETNIKLIKDAISAVDGLIVVLRKTVSNNHIPSLDNLASDSQIREYYLYTEYEKLLDDLLSCRKKFIIREKSISGYFF